MRASSQKPYRNYNARRAGSAMLACFALLACGGEISGDAEGSVQRSDEALSLLAARALARGTRETLVTGIVNVENQLFSAAGRLYVSGDEGVFELRRDGAATALTATQLVHVDGCKFGGMSERNATLYAACYDGAHSYIYAAPESATPEFQSIFKLDGVLLANGMATDGSSLFVTATGQGTIIELALDPADPLRVTERGALLEYSYGLLPNGIKIQGRNVYWGDFGTIRRAPLADPERITATISGLTFFDDFCVSGSIVLVADYLFGSVLAYSTAGVLIGGTPFGTFGNPSSVGESAGRLGFGARDLIVTEKGAGTVAVFRY
jgi:hypothetical protein